MLAGSGLACFAQWDTTQIKENALRYADISAIAFKNRDWKALARFTAPAVIEILGGVKGFESITQSFMKDVPDSAIKYIKIGQVTQLVKTDSDWQSMYFSICKWNSPEFGLRAPLHLSGNLWMKEKHGHSSTAKEILPLPG
jgi:hypothetical protein